MVCIVSSVRRKTKGRALLSIFAMGICQDGVAKPAVTCKEVTARIYEYTTQCR